MKPLSIIVCDDNVDAADSLSLVLEASGHSVITTYTGVGALSLLEGSRPNVAVLDIGLPDLTGYEIARTIRSERGGKDIVLIAVTGYGTASDKLEAHRAGFDYHFAKPVDPGMLEQFLQSVFPRQSPAR
jgi:CheY-like chemotaxis protein